MTSLHTYPHNHYLIAGNEPTYERVLDAIREVKGMTKEHGQWVDGHKVQKGQMLTTDKRSNAVIAHLVGNEPPACWNRFLVLHEGRKRRIRRYIIIPDDVYVHQAFCYDHDDERPPLENEV